MFRRLLTIVSLVAVLLAAAPASAQSVCGTRADLVTRLATVYGEVPVALGVSAQGNLVEVLTGPDGSWTILMTVPEGRACIVAVGEAWQPVPTTDREPLA